MRIKKIILFLLVIVMMLAVMCKPVNASTSYGVELISNTTTVQQGQELTITIKVKDIIDIDEGVAGLSAKLEYDSSKLEKVGAGESLNGFMIVEGDTIELAKYPGITADTEVAKFIFKAKSTGETQVKLTQVEVANGTDIFSLGRDVSKTILITTSNKPSYEPTEQLSNNNYLSSLSVDGTPISNFNKDTLTYTLSAVENDKTSMELSATAEDTKAKVTGTGIKNLEVGENTFEIVVTAEDGTQKSYKVNIERKAVVTNKEDNNKENVNNNEDDKYPTILPQAGAGSYLIIGVILAVVVVAIISFIKTRKLKGI